MIRGYALRQRFRGTLPEHPAHRQPLGPDIVELQEIGARSRDDDEVDPRRE
jgi:hypothetical protein